MSPLGKWIIEEFQSHFGTCGRAFPGILLCRLGLALTFPKNLKWTLFGPRGEEHNFYICVHCPSVGVAGHK